MGLFMIGGGMSRAFTWLYPSALCMFVLIGLTHVEPHPVAFFLGGCSQGAAHAIPVLAPSPFERRFNQFSKVVKLSQQ